MVKNLAAGGACISSYTKLAQGDKIRLEIKAPSRKSINFTGKVIWIKENKPSGADGRASYDVGIKITNITPKDREEINKFGFLHFFDSQ